MRKRLLDEAQSLKKSEEAKKLRELKKFWKKVQVEKLQARQMEKTKELTKIASFKRSLQ